MMTASHHLILGGGLLLLASILVGALSRRINAPLLLVFLVLGMLVGEDGPGGVPFDDFRAAYLIGSVALAVILFEGGLNTSLATLRSVFWPALALATVGVVVTALLVAAAVTVIGHVGLVPAMLVGAVVAPTDAAAVAALLRRSRLAVPERVNAVLEVESGLNDPMSVFLTILLIRMIVTPGGVGIGEAAWMFVVQMLGGTVLGIVGGAALVFLLRRLRLEVALAAVLALAGTLTVFGLGETLQTSGFMATYIAGIMAGAADYRGREAVGHFFDGLGWLAQIVLFVMLGLLVTPHNLVPLILPALAGTAVLLFIARPVATALCLAPFGFGRREIAFASWVGLRGAVPIYLSIVPVIGDAARGSHLFSAAFVVVIASLVAQGWTIAPFARRLGFGAAVVGPAATRELAGE
ncbi:MAG TPA: potassium/proton antiporter [Acetobacteraceae bacterium]|nr:potassium/proton antiporter [Acetobacteraceae bacterium]